MTPHRQQKLKYVAPAIALKCPYEAIDRPYVGLEHIRSWTGEINLDADATPEGIITLFEPNDILFGKLRPYLAKVALATFKGACSTEALVLRPRRGHVARYLRYVLSHLIDEVDSSTFGAKMPRASWEFIGSRPIPTPDSKTQKAIANFLDRETARVDQLIEKKQRLVELVDEKRSAFITAAVTGQIDYETGKHQPPAGGGPVSAIWFDHLPAGWTPRRIKTISPVMRGASPRPIDDPIFFDDDGEFAWVRISDVTASAGLLRQTTQRLSELGASKSVKLDPDKLFLSIAGSVGKPCVTAIKACIHDGFVYFPLLPKASQKFLYWIFESRECFAGLGKRGTQLNLNTEAVGNIAIPFPSLKTQETIADFLDHKTARIDWLKDRTSESIGGLREFRAALITAAVTGQIDVTTWRREEQTDRRLEQIAEAMSA